MFVNFKLSISVSGININVQKIFESNQFYHSYTLWLDDVF